jgi:hypothetical protein
MENISHQGTSIKSWKDSSECHWDILAFFVGHTNKLVDSAKASPKDILAFKLDYSLQTAFLY